MKIQIHSKPNQINRKNNSSYHLEVDISQKKLKSIGLSYNTRISYKDSDGFRSTASVIGLDNNNKLWVVSPIDEKTPLCLTHLDLLSNPLDQLRIWIDDEPPFNTINIKDETNTIRSFDVSLERLQTFELYVGANVVFQKTGKQATVIGIDRHNQLWFYFTNGSIGALGKFVSKTDLETNSIVRISDKSNTPIKLNVMLNGYPKLINVHPESLRSQYDLICGQPVLTPEGKGTVLGVCPEGYIWFIFGKDRIQRWEKVKDVSTRISEGILSLHEYEVYPNIIFYNPERLDKLVLEYIMNKKNELDIINKSIPAFRENNSFFTLNTFFTSNTELKNKKFDMESSELFKLFKEEEHKQELNKSNPESLKDQVQSSSENESSKHVLSSKT